PAVSVRIAIRSGRPSATARRLRAGRGVLIRETSNEFIVVLSGCLLLELPGCPCSEPVVILWSDYGLHLTNRAHRSQEEPSKKTFKKQPILGLKGRKGLALASFC